MLRRSSELALRRSSELAFRRYEAFFKIAF